MRKYNCEPSAYVDRYNRIDYAMIEWTDTKTNLSYVSDICDLKSAVGYRDMYRQYISTDMAFIKVKLIPMDSMYKRNKIKTSCIKKYKRVYRPESNHTTYNKTTDKKTLDQIQKEIVWVNIVFDHVCDMIYFESLKSYTSNKYHKVFGSMCHRGFVNRIFKNYQIDMKLLRKFVDIIGSDKSKVIDNIKQISDILPLTTYDSNKEIWCRSIYKNGFHSGYIRLICLYCEKMFDINRYIVVSLFTKNDPMMYINYANSCTNKILARRAIFQAGYTYAENDNYEKALEMFKEGIKLKADNNANFIKIIKKFKKYYRENGTTILFEQ